ncbi:MAG: transposase [Clostridiales Family XIII bacterium]|jgi:hypothetical protein|nr:transposase [Clostridiales Family XIII bacterium]
MPPAKAKQAKIIRTVRQHSEPLPEETMEFLRGLAEDYAKVKRYVYRRYSGIGSLGKIYPGYDVQKELRASGLRQELNLPDSYMAVAAMDALGGIRSAWSNLKNRIAELAKKNENLTDGDRKYIFTVLRQGAMYAAVLNDKPFERPEVLPGAEPDYRRLDNLVRRLTRKYKVALGTRMEADYFGVSPNAYAYRDGGIRLGSRTPQRRVFIPLTDNAVHAKQLKIRLLEDRIEVLAPVESKPKRHPGWTNKVALSIGYSTMFTSSGGAEYGQRLGEMLSARSERVYGKRRLRGAYCGACRKALERGDARRARAIRGSNLGTKKLLAQNRREMSGVKAYINAEIRRMLETEKPREIIIPARSKLFAPHMQKATKQKLSRWTAGYARKRLADKCALDGVKLTEVNAACTGAACADCGAAGRRSGRVFVCEACGAKGPHHLNAARNILKKAEGTFKTPQQR